MPYWRKCKRWVPSAWLHISINLRPRGIFSCSHGTRSFIDARWNWELSSSLARNHATSLECYFEDEGSCSRQGKPFFGTFGVIQYLRREANFWRLVAHHAQPYEWNMKWCIPGTFPGLYWLCEDFKIIPALCVWPCAVSVGFTLQGILRFRFRHSGTDDFVLLLLLSSSRTTTRYIGAVSWR
jgi:hypothetical protein